MRGITDEHYSLHVFLYNVPHLQVPRNLPTHLWGSSHAAWLLLSHSKTELGRATLLRLCNLEPRFQMNVCEGAMEGNACVNCTTYASPAFLGVGGVRWQLHARVLLPSVFLLVSFFLCICSIISPLCDILPCTVWLGVNCAPLIISVHFLRQSKLFWAFPLLLKLPGSSNQKDRGHFPDQSIERIYVGGVQGSLLSQDEVVETVLEPVLHHRLLASYCWLFLECVRFLSKQLLFGPPKMSAGLPLLVMKNGPYSDCMSLRHKVSSCRTGFLSIRRYKGQLWLLQTTSFMKSSLFVENKIEIVVLGCTLQSCHHVKNSLR